VLKNQAKQSLLCNVAAANSALMHSPKETIWPSVRLPLVTVMVELPANQVVEGREYGEYDSRPRRDERIE
jgi:hypothetical protein